MAQKKKTKEDPLLIRHADFIERYLSCLNGTQAWMETYNVEDKNVAAASSSRLLRHPQVRAELEKRFGEMTMGKKEVLARLRNVANASLLPFVMIDDDGNAFFNFADPEAKRHLYLIKKLKSRKSERTTKDDETITENWVEVELHDALRALELIGRYHALFTDKIEQTEKKVIKVSFKKDNDD